jgi:hypothetical protein
MDRRWVARVSKRRVVVGIGLMTAMLGACDSDFVPTAPSVSRERELAARPGLEVPPVKPAAPTRSAVTTLTAEPPQVVFKVNPAPDAERRIEGRSPFEVTFNTCRSADPEGDKLLYTLDADGDGRLDEAGTHGGNCRSTVAYTAAEGETRDVTATACVVDLDATGQPQRSPECRSYAVRVFGPPPAAPPTPAVASCPILPVLSKDWRLEPDASGEFESLTATCRCEADGAGITALTFAETCVANNGEPDFDFDDEEIPRCFCVGDGD